MIFGVFFKKIPLICARIASFVIILQGLQEFSKNLQPLDLLERKKVHKTSIKHFKMHKSL